MNNVKDIMEELINLVSGYDTPLIYPEDEDIGKQLTVEIWILQ